MNKAVEKFRNEREGLTPLTKARTRSGVEFAPDQEKWCFRDGITRVLINFALVPQSCASLVPGLKRTLLWYLENRAPASVPARFSEFLWLARQLDGRDAVIQRIEAEDILIIKNSSAKAEHRLAHLRSFLIKWTELGAPGVGEDVLYLLKRLSLKQYPVGVAVATLDPGEGPLTDLEFEAIQLALNNAYTKFEIDSEQLLLCYLLMALGSRPVQLASLKCSDLIVPENPDGDYVLRVPRAKQRDQLARSEFKWRKLTRQIGEPLTAHVQKIKAEFGNQFHDVNEVPLFPQRQQANLFVQGFEFHLTPNGVTERVIGVFSKLRVPSERLEGSIPVNARRLRRTFATRAAEEGWPMLVLAELMDHADTRQVYVYAGLTSRIRAEFSRKIALDMAPLAMAFAGKVIRGEDDATRPEQSSRIVDFRVDRSGASMGSCGSYAHCGFARPIACYAGCFDFEPWLDGPHDAALDYMLERRAELMATTDTRIATINDRAILGCAQVILRCRQILSEGNHD